jgi:hypothetical protein
MATVSYAQTADSVLTARVLVRFSWSSLSSSRKSGYYPSAKSADETDGLIYQESLAWSFFLNNAIFICSFLFLAFYVLRSVETL